MFVRELGRDSLDRALDAERFAATDATERLLLLENARRRHCGAEIDLRPERDDFLRACRPAQSTLHAGIFGKTQCRSFRIVTESPGRADRHAGQAERATCRIDLD